MSFCASCALEISSDLPLCGHHHTAYADDWAIENRMYCEFFHRGKDLPRLPKHEREAIDFVSDWA